ncbi:TonB-linked SusC/RagA family outer membrane protein [Mangrovibacterium diazotrophicum]|uniref:TonB-linked SusC/RagA family outer membrane protein n=2 Tax=Mangrovibacterium diazotrophicum TaxID=1261403 RepID=A0A419W4I3_9BACT|nr:TonB-linked SusC/RagA family outer membrane protein [Mangrovibacterium diazotrophicum]
MGDLWVPGIWYQMRKILIPMKLSLCIVLLSILTAQGSVFSQSTALSLNHKNSTVKEILGAIEDQSEFRFAFSSEYLDLDRKVSIQSSNESISNILKEVFQGTSVKYTINDRMIILYNDAKEDAGSLQQQNVSGRVTDSEGTPLPGVTVVVKGTTQGTITDDSGRYSITNVPADAILQFSFVGMKLQEVVVSGKSQVNVVLEEETIGLEEVVAVGYGTVKRADLTGAISSVSAEQIKKVPVTSVGEALQGQMSGVQVSSNDGTPGGGVQVLIRGIGSFGNNSPLYVIDGYPGASTSLNPDEIETIDVLKDASAAAIYGNRAANGVVIITTKRGSRHGLEVSVNATSSYQFMPKTYDVLNAQEFAQIATEIADAEGSSVLDEWYSPSSLRTLDWQDAMYRSGLKQIYSVGLRGGSEKSQTALSLGMTDHKGIVEFSNYKRYNVSLAQDYTPLKWLKSSTSVKFAHVNDKTIFGSGQSRIGTLARLIPTMTGNPETDEIKDADGNYGYYDLNAIATYNCDNVYKWADQRDVKDITNKLNASTSLEITPIKGLKLKTLFGIDYDVNEGYSFSPADEFRISPREASYRQFSTNSMEWLWENTVSYSLKLDNHELDIMVGVSAQENTTRTLSSTGTGLESDELRSIALLDNYTSTGYQQIWSLASEFSRLTYKFKDKYIVTGTVRRDGSSRFAEGNQYGVFPSVSGAWKANEESFLQGVEGLSNLKLRASYGEAGNQSIGLFQYESTYTTGSENKNYGYAFGENKVYATGLVQSYLPNSDLKWETSTQTDIGLDLGVMNNKLTLTADYYVKKSKDFLLNIQVPAQTGYTSATRNVGSVENKGFEFSLGYKNYDNPFKFGVNFNVTTVNNKIVSLSKGKDSVANLQSLDFSTTGDESWAVFSMSYVGGSIGDFYGFQEDGIIQTQAEIDALNENAKAIAQDDNVWYISSGTQAGDRKFVDQNGDGVITDDDKVTIGSPIPDFYGGITFNGEYKNFDFNLFFNYSVGNDILNYMKRNLTSININGSVGMENVSKEYYNNRWTESNPSNEFARATWADENSNSRISDVFVEDGSYLRFKNIEVGYTVPSRVLSKLAISKLRVFMSAQNLFTITGYSGLDPEIGQSVGNSSGAGGVTASGVDVGQYPYSKFMTLGVNVQF